MWCKGNAGGGEGGRGAREGPGGGGRGAATLLRHPAQCCTYAPLLLDSGHSEGEDGGESGVGDGGEGAGGGEVLLAQARDW